MFWLLTSLRPEAPWPPIPIPALFSLLFGDVSPAPKATWLGSAIKAVTALLVARNWRRENLSLLTSSPTRVIGGVWKGSGRTFFEGFIIRMFELLHGHILSTHQDGAKETKRESEASRVGLELFAAPRAWPIHSRAEEFSLSRESRPSPR